MMGLISALVFVVQPAPALPAEWHGQWKGQCNTGPIGAKTTEFPMELHITPLGEPGQFTWKIIYGEGEKRQVRDYQLNAVKAEPNRFIVDEKNGILIDTALAGNVLHSHFKVGDVMIHARYELKDKVVDVELTTFDVANPRETKPNADLTVLAHRLKAVQRGQLKRTDRPLP